MLELIVVLIVLVTWLICDIIVYCKRKKEEQHYCLGGLSRRAKRIGNRIKIAVTVVGVIIIVVNFF